MFQSTPENLPRPFETVGCWYNNSYLISSDHEWLAHQISVNKFWINKVISTISICLQSYLHSIFCINTKVDYSMDSDPSLACMRQLYRLYNCSGSAIRDITVVPLSKSTVFNFNSGNNNNIPLTTDPYCYIIFWKLVRYFLRGRPE